MAVMSVVWMGKLTAEKRAVWWVFQMVDKRVFQMVVSWDLTMEQCLQPMI